MAWKFWQDISPTDYMDIEYVGQADENIKHIKNLLLEYLGAQAEHIPVDLSMGYQTQPLPEFLNKIEQNINNLEKEITWLVKRQKGRIWLGEYSDNPTFRYSDVNRWFSDLSVMKLALGSIPMGWRKSGTFSCGNNYLVQILRR